MTNLVCDALHILGLGPFIAIDYLETDVFSFVQGFVPLPQNRRMVDENILSGLLGDKTETAFVVEPFDFSTGHIVPSMPKRHDEDRAALW